MLKRTNATKAACLFMIALAWCSSAQARLLRAGENLSAGQVMHSESGRYFATMQHDGNFVVYRLDGHPIWSTNTTGTGAVTANMQQDGNFVLYDAAGRAIWWTASNGRNRLFAITEFGQAMVIAPGRVKSGTPGPGTELWRSLRMKPVWSARQYDYVPGRLGDGPRCVGDPHTCGAQLHGRLHHGP